MPTLHWIGKEKVINHHQDVPFRTLHHEYGFDNGQQNAKATDSGNKISNSDKLEFIFYEKKQASRLNRSFLRQTRQPAEYYVINADVCLLSNDFM